MNCHKEEDDVKLLKKYPQRERERSLKNLRLQGICLHNKDKLMKKDNNHQELMIQRSQTN